MHFRLKVHIGVRNWRVLRTKNCTAHQVRPALPGGSKGTPVDKRDGSCIGSHQRNDLNSSIARLYLSGTSIIPNL